ncbi:MAG: LysR substrate-binding domain-containing protein [Coprococcus sp.]
MSAFFPFKGRYLLTPAGKIYFNVFSQYIDNMANATILVRNMTGTVKHKLIIGHLEMLDIRLTLSSVVQKLKQRYPDIELEYRSYRDYELPQALHDNRIDLAITLGPEIQPDLIIRTVPLTKIQDFCSVARIILWPRQPPHTLILKMRMCFCSFRLPAISTSRFSV